MDNNSERVGDSGGSGELKKTAKLTAITDSSGADAQRRLVEYFVVISSVEQKEKKKSEKGDRIAMTCPLPIGRRNPMMTMIQ
jgi:hypothetical protein